MATVEIEGKQYEVTGYAEDGLPIVQGHAVTVNHTDENGNQIFDEDGNPKVSVHVHAFGVAQSPVEEGAN